MITYPLDFSGLLTPSQVSFTPRTSTGFSESPFTFEQQVFVHSGAAWNISVVYAPCDREDAEEIIGQLLALNGQEGTFLLGDPANRLPRGNALGEPAVLGDGQSGRTLQTDGWTPNTADILLRGDWIQLGEAENTHLHKIVAPASSDNYGGASLEIWPPLRESPGDEDLVIFQSPVGLWRLAPGQGGWTIGEAKIYGIQFDAIEAL